MSGPDEQDRLCTKCRKPVRPADGFDVGTSFYCRICFVDVAQEHRQLAKEDRNLLRREVKEEMAALIAFVRRLSDQERKQIELTMAKFN
jgi:hypothetical protein